MPRFRPTARLLVLDPADRVLLFSAQDPRGRLWFTPGGGVHRGESLEAAAARELAEETGHIASDVGPVVATRAGLWTAADGQAYFGADAFFLVRVREPAVDTSRQEPLERSYITGYRWWTAGEIRVSEERFFPVELGMLLDRLIRDGAPVPRSRGARPVRLAWDA
jgi:8-oxo-dGTP pyrophosphatase MutT (NUDIX family)